MVKSRRVLVAALISVAGCYSPDVGEGQFTCTPEDTRCPKGFECDPCTLKCLLPVHGCGMLMPDMPGSPDASIPRDATANGKDLPMSDDAAPPPDLALDATPLPDLITVDLASCVDDPNACTGRCGMLVNNCARTVTCMMTCTAPESCGGGGTVNVCGCTPMCVGAVCGAADGCNGLCSAGTCMAPDTCGGGGTANVCGCTRDATCDGTVCGTVKDNCGNLCKCGTATPNCNNNACQGCGSNYDCTPKVAHCTGGNLCAPCGSKGDCTNPGWGNNCTGGKCTCGGNNDCNNNRALRCSGGSCVCGSTGGPCPLGKPCTGTGANDTCA